MIRKLGVFHCGKGIIDEPPITTLERVFRETTQDPYDAMIVLPEAFNLKGAYLASAKYEFEASTGPRLRKLAKRHGVAFVVGLIEASPGRFSSVYLIAPDLCHLLGRKTSIDDTAKGQNGTSPLYQKSCECDTPLPYAQLVVAALICIDTDEAGRPKSLRLKLPVGDPTICVTARTYKLNTRKVAEDWTGTHFALANAFPGSGSVPQQSPSIIAVRGAPLVEYSDPINDLFLQPLTTPIY